MRLVAKECKRSRRRCTHLRAHGRTHLRAHGRTHARTDARTRPHNPRRPRYFKILRDKKVKHVKRNLDRVMLALIWVASRNEQLSRTFGELSKSTGANESQLKKLAGKLAKKLKNFKVVKSVNHTANTAELVPRFCDGLEYYAGGRCHPAGLHAGRRRHQGRAE